MAENIFPASSTAFFRFSIERNYAGFPPISESRKTHYFTPMSFARFNVSQCLTLLHPPNSMGTIFTSYRPVTDIKIMNLLSEYDCELSRKAICKDVLVYPFSDVGIEVWLIDSRQPYVTDARLLMVDQSKIMNTKHLGQALKVAKNLYKNRVIIGHAMMCNNTLIKKLKTGYHGEIISESSLNYNTPLPNEDPRGIDLPIIQEMDLPKKVMLEASSTNKLNFALQFNEKLTKNELCVNIIPYLNNRNIQFNSRVNFSNFKPWVSVIKSKITQKKPIEIIIPFFCNIGNPLKRFQPTDLTCAEKVTVNFIKNIAKDGRKVYPCGFKFYIVADANFYSTSFFNNIIETNNYINNLKLFIINSGYSHYVEVIDMMDVISNKSLEFTDKFHFWMNKTEGSINNDLVKWEDSMISSINLRHIVDYEEIKKCYNSKKTEIRKYVEQRARTSLQIYRSLKYAAADIFWEEEISENFIRSTIHTKQIPVLGLRIYPEYKKSSKLLPYHGVAFFSKKNNRYRMKIITEMEAVMTPNTLRIKNANGLTQGYISDEIEN